MTNHSDDKVDKWLLSLLDLSAMSSSRNSSRLQAKILMQSPPEHELNPSDFTVSSYLDDGSDINRSASHSARSRSPTKKVTDLKLSELKDEFKDFRTQGCSVPTEATSLFKDLRSVEDKRQIIPLGVKDEVLEYLTETETEACANFFM